MFVSVAVVALGGYLYGLELAVAVGSATLARASLALHSDARPRSASLLIKGARQNNAELIEVLVRGGVPLNEAGEYGSALHAAVTSRSEEALQVLLRLGADTEIRDAWGGTALHVAASLRAAESLVRALVQADADVNAKDAKGQTPLHQAVSTETMRILVAAGANINATDKAGKAPLHAWAGPRSVQPGMIREAVRLGADPAIRDVHGSTPGALARSAGNQDAVAELEQRLGSP